MAIFENNTLTSLYWAESTGYAAGRDPMGIQNSSVVTIPYIYVRSSDKWLPSSKENK